jgi:predicted dehydrogenase
LRRKKKMSNLRKQRLGVIGWLYYYDNDYALTVAACDTKEKKIKDFKLLHPDADVFTDYKEMAEKSDLDAVIISTPNWFHREMAEYFLDRGVNVFLEKPMGVNKEEIDAVVRAQRRSGKICAIDFELRNSYGYKRVKEILDSGEIGSPAGLEFIHHRGGWLASGNGVWRTNPKLSGGLFFMEVCHEIDIARFLFGEISAVQSFSHPNLLPQYPDNMPDNVVTHIWFEKGFRGTIITSHTASVFNAPEERYDDLGHDMYWIITGTEGCIRMDDIKKKLLICRYADYHPDASIGKRVEFKRLEDYSSIPFGRFGHDIVSNHLEFLRCCSMEKPFHQDTLDAWKTHFISLAAEKSAVENSKKIKIDFVLPV